MGSEPDLRTLDRIHATAWLLGERIESSSIPTDRLIARSPLTLRGAEGTLVVLYRFGTAVVFAPDRARSATRPQEVGDFVARPFEVPESDEAEIRVSTSAPEGPDAGGTIVIREASLERLHVVADVLARSAFLAHYEVVLGSSMDRVEALAERLRQGRHVGLRTRRLLEELGEVLVTELRMVGRAEVSEKPGRIWDAPDLDALYTRMAEEYELRDRDRAVTRKLELLGRAAGSFLDVLSNRRSLHVEWYIVILILIEIIILMYDLSTR
jgi:uncharacterized Rmd1/YagE family protein